ncbi:MAG: lipid-A-disaccharide synthase [Marinifilaceae bacterium]
MKYYVIAGEASGDLHASNLIKNLFIEDPTAQVRGWGGDKMKDAGCQLVRHYKETAIMGFVTVLRNLGTIKRNIEECCNDILQWKPDVVILVDYAGFNLRIAKFAKAKGIKVYYYISPKIWAWNTGRVKQIKRYVDKMYVIFPFEESFYKNYNYDVTYCGNPLVDAVAAHDYRHEGRDVFLQENNLADKPIIALVAGSRAQELKHVLPKMLEMVQHFQDYQFVIAGAPSMSDEDYAPFIAGYDVKIIYGQTYRLIYHAHAALVTSGTATLETALIGTPQVVCYAGEGGALSYYLFKTFVKVDYISLVNLIMGQEVVKELLMHKLNEHNLLEELTKIVHHERIREKMIRNYGEVRQRLGKVGTSMRFAKQIVADLKEGK